MQKECIKMVRQPLTTYRMSLTTVRENFSIFKAGTQNFTFRRALTPISFILAACY